MIAPLPNIFCICDRAASRAFSFSSFVVVIIANALPPVQNFCSYFHSISFPSPRQAVLSRRRLNAGSRGNLLFRRLIGGATVGLVYTAIIPYISLFVNNLKKIYFYINKTVQAFKGRF
jgi:hypothetical protein